MPKRPNEPLRKITINIFDSDARALETIYGWGWSEQIRNLIREHIKAHRPRRTIGDLIEPEA